MAVRDAPYIRCLLPCDNFYLVGFFPPVLRVPGGGGFGGGGVAGFCGLFSGISSGESNAKHRFEHPNLTLFVKPRVEIRR